MPSYGAIFLQGLLWVIVVLSVLGMTLVPLSLFVEEQIGRHRARRKRVR